MVETTPGGATAAVVTVDTNAGGAGNLFGLAVKPGADAVYFVDDFGNDNKSPAPLLAGFQKFLPVDDAGPGR